MATTTSMSVREINSLATGPLPITGNDHLQYAVKLMRLNLYFAASAILRPLFDVLKDQEEKSRVAHLIVSCGIGLNSKMLMADKFLGFLPENDKTRKMASLLSSDSTHEMYRVRASNAAIENTHRKPFDEGTSIVVCAGAQHALQLWCNLTTLLNVIQHTTNVIIVHADEIDESLQEKFLTRFARSLVTLQFVDVSDEFGIENLRGFQIKLAAIASTKFTHRNVLLVDADILWLDDPARMIDDLKKREIPAFLFNDFWHFKTKRHERSASTSFLYELHCVDANMNEFESGVVYFDRQVASSAVAVLRQFAIDYTYYFALTFGDKDLYYLALKISKASTTSLNPPAPKMLGVVGTTSDNKPAEFHSQSMLQSYRDGWLSHVHCTLHPIGDDFFKSPNAQCDGKYVEFVQRTLGDKIVGTVACAVEDAIPLETTLIRMVYGVASSAKREF